MKNLIICSVLIAIFINLLLPKFVMPFATPDEIKPPNGAKNLSFKEQIMHMLVHHAQVPITSSLIIALIVFLSIGFGMKLCSIYKL